MKLIGTGDDHFDEASPRWDECVRVHSWIADLVEGERPDVFLDGGDIYERASTPRERAAVADWLTRIAQVCPVVITKGNHDRSRDLELLGRLKTRHPITVVEDARVVYVAGAAIACVAWPDRAQLLAQALEHGADGDDLAQSALRAVLAGLGAELAAHRGPRIGLGHFMVDGSITSVGQPLVGHAMNVGLADLGLLGADITLMSHIHAPQEWIWNGCPIAYLGSPYRTSYGETEQKSVMLATIDRVLGREHARLDFQRVPTPCAGMVLIQDEWDPSEPGGWAVGDGVPAECVGAEVRFRYAVDADQRSAARAAAEQLASGLLAAGALAVKLDERVRPTTRARAPEIAQATTLADKMAALWNARGTTPEPERAARLQVMAAELEEEATRAA